MFLIIIVVHNFIEKVVFPDDLNHAGVTPDVTSSCSPATNSRHVFTLINMQLDKYFKRNFTSIIMVKVLFTAFFSY